MSRELSPQQRLFIKNYLSGMSATDAAKQAGYSEKHAGKQAYKLLLIKKVKQAVEGAKKTFDKSVEKIRREVEEEIGFSFEKKLRILNEIAIGTEYETSDRIKAIEVANKMQGDNAPDKSINQNTNIVIEERTKAMMDMAEQVYDELTQGKH